MKKSYDVLWKSQQGFAGPQKGVLLPEVGAFKLDLEGDVQGDIQASCLVWVTG